MLKLVSPAKINLWLKVEGRRPDGFHELTSLVLPLVFGDFLEVDECSGECDKLECSDPRVPLGNENLILKAADAFRQKTGLKKKYHFRLEKKIPPGGGFGGGSGNAVTALRAMNQMEGNPLTRVEMHQIAADIGSDCPLFLYDQPSIIRGRGEKVQGYPNIMHHLARYHILIFDPGFSISTAWVFQEWFKMNGIEYDRKTGEGKLAKFPWEGDDDGHPANWIRNDLGDVIREKYLVYNALWNLISPLKGVFPGITGSGSGCFFLCDNCKSLQSLRELLEGFWPEIILANGPLFLVETKPLQVQNNSSEDLRS